MSMFAKVSFKSFVYDLIDVFCFPSEEVRKIYNQYDIIKCHMYLNLTDSKSSSWFFIYIYKKECNTKESELRKLIFKILKDFKVAERRNVPNKFWQQFKIRNENVKKQMGLYEIENIDNANICTNAVNPNKYFEKFSNRPINKKHKGEKRNSPGINFERSAERIKVLG